MERLQNLIALINLSNTDIPQEIVKTWVDETLAELMKMEGIDPPKNKKEHT